MDSARRTAYLDAMGITPWVRRALPVEAMDEAPPAEQPVAESAPATPPPVPAASQPPPKPKASARPALLHEHEASHLPAWLLTRSLAGLSGGIAATLGKPDADLMVLEAPLGGGKSLCDGQAGQLLERMLRAIGQSRRSSRSALLASPEAPVIASLAEYLSLRPPRAILLLAELPENASPAALEHLRIAHPRLPEGSALLVSHHPRQLLANPALKRTAWQDLKRLHRLLTR